MSDTLNIKYMIKQPRADVFRRCFIKRRSVSTGLFETSWQDISVDVKSWGKYVSTIDPVRRSRFTFANAKITMFNSEGRYNPHSDDSSLWNGYLNQQRTLVRIDAGFVNREKQSSGIWVNTELPGESLWDDDIWDGSLWDGSGSTLFKGIISGDIILSDKDEVTLNIKPLVSVFQDYPARRLTGWTSTGMTASQFVTMLRDQTDGAGSFVFRPFFEDTTTYWDISTTSIVYSNLNTSTANDVFDKTVWEVLEKLSEVENFVPYVSRDGTFKFVSRTANTSTASYEFYGAGSFDSEFGHTIKQVSSFGFRQSKYYSRIQLKWIDLDTATSYEIRESSFVVSGSNNPWVLGEKTLNMENFYIPSSAVATTIASTIFTEVSALKNEVEFTTSFIPHLELLDLVSVSYDPSEVNQYSLWDQNDWAAEVTVTATDLIWDGSRGDAINLAGQEFKFLSQEIDLDRLENKYIAREV